MAIYKVAGKDVRFKPWSEVLGVKHFPIPGAVQHLFTSKECEKIGATIEKMNPFPPFTWQNNYDEAWYMISGKLIVESEGRKHEYKTGDFGMATKGTYTMYVPDDSEEDTICFVVHCPPIDGLIEDFRKISR